jgi:hypothetical protein
MDSDEGLERQKGKGKRGTGYEVSLWKIVSGDFFFHPSLEAFS